MEYNYFKWFIIPIEENYSFEKTKEIQRKSRVLFAKQENSAKFSKISKKSPLEKN